MIKHIKKIGDCYSQSPIFEKQHSIIIKHTYEKTTTMFRCKNALTEVINNYAYDYLSIDCCMTSIYLTTHNNIFSPNILINLLYVCLFYFNYSVHNIKKM